MAGSGVTDTDYMRKALALAERGRLTCRPNPMVGAVVVKDGRIVGEGFHAEAGQPHAEVFALEGPEEDMAGATLFVTLEPCSHTGRTSPCADLVIREGLARVVCAMQDPDTRVSGRGTARLRDAGVKVEVGLMGDEARRQNAAYIKHRATGLPYVTLKLAQTLDGRIATASGDSKWITSEASRTIAHRLRAEADAVLVGAGTVRADDPELSVRHVSGRSPAKIVLDSRLTIGQDAKVFAGAPLVLASAEGISESDRRDREAAGAKVWTVPCRNARLYLRAVLERAAAQDMISVLIEGGGQVAASALGDGLVDRVAVFVAPKILGDGIQSVGDLGIAQVSGAVRLENIDVERIGEDLYYTADVKKHGAT